MLRYLALAGDWFGPLRIFESITVRAALDRCAFFAFDCEMTGLASPGCADAALDDAHPKARRRIAADRQRSTGCSHAPRPGWQPDVSTVTAN